jgi:hypothetical protein
MQRYCTKELNMYCSAIADAAVLGCLYYNRENLSQDCGAVLLETSAGACDAAAISLCPAETSVDEITSCLTAHRNEVEDQCTINLQHESERRSLAFVMREKYYERTSIVITICTFYLLIAVVAWIWATRMNRALQTDQEKYIETKIDSLASSSIDNMGSTEGMKDGESTMPPISIKLLNISYRCNSRDYFSEVT